MNENHEVVVAPRCEFRSTPGAHEDDRYVGVRVSALASSMRAAMRSAVFCGVFEGGQGMTARFAERVSSALMSPVEASYHSADPAEWLLDPAVGLIPLGKDIYWSTPCAVSIGTRTAAEPSAPCF